MRRSFREGGQRKLILAGALILLAACAVVLGWVLGRISLPTELDRPLPVTRSEVQVDEFSDARTVDLSVTLLPSTKIIVQSGGLLTASSCSPDTEIANGTSTFAVDGQPLVNLSTTHPLWRTLAVGAKGEDVRELQQALVAAGFQGSVDGVVGNETIAFFNGLRRASVADTPLVTEIASSSVLWLSSGSVKGATCLIQVGSVLQPGDALAELPPQISKLQLGTMPQVLPDQPRTVSIDGVVATVDSEGGVEQEAWPTIAETSSFRAYVADPESVAFKANVQLAEPVELAQVPPSAIFGTDGGAGCVADGDTTYVGTVVSSELGYTLMKFEQSIPLQVDLSPPAGRSCP